MNKNIYRDFTESYYDTENSYEFNDQEILDYFYQNANNELITEDDYHLIIENKRSDNDDYLKYDKNTKTFYFNKRTFKILLYIKSNKMTNLTYEYNYTILELLNEILAAIALERDLKNPNFISINPFFCYGILSADIFGIQNILSDNYIYIKKSQLFNKFYNICIENYGLDNSLKNNLNDNIREYLLDSRRKTDKNICDKMLLKTAISSFPIDNGIKFKYGEEELELLNKYTEPKNDSTTYLLNSLLCSKKLSKEKKEVIKNERIYILDYAEREIIKDLNNKILKLVK